MALTIAPITVAVLLELPLPWSAAQRICARSAIKRATKRATARPASSNQQPPEGAVIGLEADRAEVAAGLRELTSASSSKRRSHLESTGEGPDATAAAGTPEFTAREPPPSARVRPGGRGGAVPPAAFTSSAASNPSAAAAADASVAPRPLAASAESPPLSAMLSHRLGVLSERISASALGVFGGLVEEEEVGHQATMVQQAGAAEGTSPTADRSAAEALLATGGLVVASPRTAGEPPGAPPPAMQEDALNERGSLAEQSESMIFLRASPSRPGARSLDA